MRGRDNGRRGGGRNNRRSDRRRGRRQSRSRQNAGFWGDASQLPEPRTDVRMTTRPAALPRSLGPAPLSGYEAIAAHYFDAVYERAVTTAGALAAAGGLIDPETLEEELSR